MDCITKSTVMGKLSLKIYTLLLILYLVGWNQSTQAGTPAGESLQTEQRAKVYYVGDKALVEEYEKLNLDATHPNLLNPQVSENEHDAVVKSWSELHQRIGSYLSQKGFDWGTEAPTISIVHKIYFDQDGKITSYFFNVLNPAVEAEKKKEFAQLLTDFAQENSIALKREENFAQCGKTRYENN